MLEIKMKEIKRINEEEYNYNDKEIMFKMIEIRNNYKRIKKCKKNIRMLHFKPKK